MVATHQAPQLHSNHSLMLFPFTTGTPVHWIVSSHVFGGHLFPLRRRGSGGPETHFGRLRTRFLRGMDVLSPGFAITVPGETAGVAEAGAGPAVREN